MDTDRLVSDQSTTSVTAKEKVAEVKEKVAAGVTAAADHAAQLARDPERRKAAQTAAETKIRRNPWLAVGAAFLVGIRLGRKLHLPRR